MLEPDELRPLGLAQALGKCAGRLGRDRVDAATDEHAVVALCHLQRTKVRAQSTDVLFDRAPLGPVGQPQSEVAVKNEPI